jgi:hypothetical protein
MMDRNFLIGFSLGLVMNLVIFWIILQLTLAAWESKKAKEHWVSIVNTPMMQLIKIKWLSGFLFVAIVFQLTMMMVIFSLKFYAASISN